MRFVWAFSRVIRNIVLVTMTIVLGVLCLWELQLPKWLLPIALMPAVWLFHWLHNGTRLSLPLMIGFAAALSGTSYVCMQNSLGDNDLIVLIVTFAFPMAWIQRRLGSTGSVMPANS